MDKSIAKEPIIAESTNASAAPPQSHPILEKIRLSAEEKGWACLTTEYHSWKQKYLFQCELGHTWYEQPQNMKRRSRCPGCIDQEFEIQRQATLKSLHEIAQSRGGKCLSMSYLNQHEKLEFECHMGHQWSALPQTIKRGCWCPECSTGLGERITREFFEQIFKAKFPISYPKWLVNSEGNHMELDGYCEVLGLAFEHQGGQHYSEQSHFIDTAEKLQKRLRDDEIKARLCAEHNIKLFIIPEVPRLTTFNELKNLIKKESDRLGVLLPPDFDFLIVNYLKAYQPNRLKELRQIAEAHGGKLKSDHYLGTTEKLLFDCENHHEFWASPVSVARQGTWCRLCATELTAKKLRASLDDVREIAIAKGGICLSDEYLGAHHKYKFKCHLGHEWEATRANITLGKWCPFCADIEHANKMRGQNRKDPDGKTGIERCHEVAAQRDGVCLSETYLSARAPMRWKCNKDGQEWEACLDSIVRGSWCPHPEHNGGVRLTLEIAQARARERGGECLSTEYINARTKLRWRCHRGHEWEESPAISFKRKKWCRQCHRESRKGQKR